MFMTYITNVDISSTRADKKQKANRPIIEQDCQTTESQAQDWMSTQLDHNYMYSIQDYNIEMHTER